MTSQKAIFLTRNHYRMMERDVIIRAPEEACGLLGGQGDIVKIVQPITNLDQSTTRFTMDPKQMLDFFIELDRTGLELMGIYHSHPKGPSTPSATDMLESNYPHTPNLIWSDSSKTWSCRAYLISRENYLELPIKFSCDE